jgi:DNA-binding SARP family transcriptional activator
MLSLRLCGAVALTTDDGELVTMGSKALALLSVLALEPRAHLRDELATLLWGEYPDAKAKASLRQALTHLREGVGEALHVDRSAVSLTAPMKCDVVDFLRLARDDPWAAIEVDVPHFLEGLAIHRSPGFDDWAERHRSALYRSYRDLLADCVREAQAKMRWRDAVRVADRWRDIEPLADQPVAALMEAHFIRGDGGAAGALFAEHKARLAADGSRVVGRELSELAARIERTAGIASTSPRAGEAWYDQGPTFTASLIGRSAEWELLRERWEEVSRGESRVVLIEGEPGAGKTRLAGDFARWAASSGGVILHGRGYDSHAGPPFAAVIEMLSCAVDIPGVSGVAPEWLAEVARVVPRFRARFSKLPEVASTGAAEGWRLFEGIAQVMTAIAEDGPVMLVIDDLHWCDADSCSLLHYLVRRLQDQQVLWCVTFTLGACMRDAPAARLARALRAASDAATVVLAPLGEEGIWRLLQELGRVEAPAGGRRLAARIHEVTAGNPFYVIELLKTMFAQGLLSADPATGVWTVMPETLAASSVKLSPSVHEAVAERIECLPDELRNLLITLAVAGRGCNSDVISRLHGISRLHAAARADSLVERHLAEDTDGVFRCAHPVIAHVVREGLSTARRREVHRALALALELVRASSPGENADAEIARHADQAGERAMAYKYAISASEACARRYAFEEALSWLDLAAGAAGGAAESGVVDRITARLLEVARESQPAPATVR